MYAWLRRFAGSVLTEGAVAALAQSGSSQDCRAALCRWEDALFAQYPEGHRIMTTPEATALIEDVFAAFGRAAPQLELVPGFEDPRIGGFADVKRHRIVIENGCLYRFLVLHEAAHILVPEDRHHGPVFIYVLQTLYRAFLDVPETAVRELLTQHGLPSYTVLPEPESLAIAA
ncbi:MAG: hypothetical protein JWL84_5399 [Rhodospirillales bacterium]|jgi:hypothetical protein|nr:hypothetical protein [Rhodospirillales bacterium]